MRVYIIVIIAILMGYHIEKEYIFAIIINVDINVIIENIIF